MEVPRTIVEAIGRIVPLGEDELATILGSTKVLTLARKQYLIRAGEVCHDVYFIRKGGLRYYRLSKKDAERTGQFFFEGDFYTDYDSFLRQSPTSQYIQALEPTEVELLSRQALYQGYEQHPLLERFGRIMAE